jgi:hypothetical protein
MLSRSHGSLTQAIHRALASVAVFAQVLLLFSPLLEIRHGEGRAAISVAIASQQSGSWIQSHGSAIPHNPTTCPACIAQSLHAQVAPGVRLPTLLVAELAPVETATAVLPHHDPPSTHHSRAPPVVS